MALELLLDDAPALAPLALAVELGWVSLPLPLRTVPHLTADEARARADALVVLPAVEYALVQQSHLIVPALAAGGQHGSATVLVADRRLDEIEAPTVDLEGASRGAECLARATLGPFYGISGTVWTREGEAGGHPPGGRSDGHHDSSAAAGDGAAAETQVAGEASLARPTVLVREGGEALHLLDEPGIATVADLGRAWFILTALPPVSHLFLAPRALPPADEAGLRELTEALPGALATIHERRRELRRELSDRYGVSRERLNDFYNDQFSTLTGDAQKSVLALLARGGRGVGLPPVARLNLAGDAPHV
jgi:hypothetical protein